MLAIIVRRLIQGSIVILLLSAIVFIGIFSIGNPVDLLVSDSATAAERQSIMENYGLDKPLVIQYLLFLSRAVRGDFGNSFITGEPVTKTFIQRLPATLELAFFAAVLATVIGVGIGLYSGIRPESPLAKLGMASMAISFSIPLFWIAMVGIMVFAVNMNILPSGRRGNVGIFLGIKSSLFTWDGIRHLLLPAFCMSLSMMSLLARMTRTAVSEIVQLEHVIFAKAKGVAPFRVVRKHVLRNVLIPIVTAGGNQLANLIAFAVVVETIFNWPGIGKLLIDSINSIDRPAVLMQLIFTAVLFIGINLIVDITYAFLDPRIRDIYRGTV